MTTPTSPDAPQRHRLILPLFRPNLDVTFKVWMGGATYLENLARVLSLLPEAERPQVLVMTDGPIDTPVVRALYRHAAVEAVFTPSGAPLSIKRPLYDDLITGMTPDTGKVAALLSAPSAVFPVFRTNYRPPNAVHWIPDFQHKYLPHMFDADELARRDADFSAMAMDRANLVLSSQAARADLKRFYPGAAARVFVWPFVSGLDLTTAAALDPRDKYGLPEKYLLAPNQFWKHKDHRTAFEAIRLLKQRGHDIVLACTGKASDFRHPNHFDELRSFVAEHGLGDAIKILGVVPQGDLVQLLRYAAAVIQPSLFEGWSTVVEDAKAIGRPMILSDLDVHVEQCAGLDGVRFFARSDAAALAKAIDELWPSLAPGPNSETERNAVINRRARELESARAFVGILDAINPVGARNRGT